LCRAHAKTCTKPASRGLAPKWPTNKCTLVERIGRRCPFRAPRFGCDQLRPQLIGKPGDNFILHIKQIGHDFIEALGPEMRAALGVNKLHIDATPIAGTLNAALQHIRYVQFAPDLLNVEGLAFVSKCRVACDYE